MHRPFFIDLRSLPETGKDISGQENPAFFDLDPKDPIQATSPLKYDLHVERDGGDLLVSGSLEAHFSLECGACLERFDYRVEMEHYAS